MSNWFTRIFVTNDGINDGYNQEQREALLDLFNFCMSADRRIEFSEQDFITAETNYFNWESSESVAEFSKHSMQRANQAHKTDAARKTYALEINERLQTNELRAQAVWLSHKLFKVDSDYAKEEKLSFSIIATAFGWAQ